MINEENVKEKEKENDGVSEEKGVKEIETGFLSSKVKKLFLNDYIPLKQQFDIIYAMSMEHATFFIIRVIDTKDKSGYSPRYISMMQAYAGDKMVMERGRFTEKPINAELVYIDGKFMTLDEALGLV